MVRGSRREAEAAFSELFNRYSSRIHAYAYRILNDQEAAEDVYQETFVRFHKALRDGAEMQNLTGFLFTISKNLCLNYLKSKKRRNTVPIEDYDFEVFNHTYESEELMNLIAMALDLLDFEFREAFVLREYQGMSYAEVAEMTGTTLATAKIRVHRAKQKIKTILKPYVRDILAI